MEAELAEARAAYDADPADESATIWLGRRLAYLGRVREAVEVFTAGLEHHPRSVRLLRHRGHRFITLRDFDAAWNDLLLATKFLQEDVVPDEVEPDGQPNASNQPRSTLHSNIFYHLALAAYLKGDFGQAASLWGATLSQMEMNDDNRVAFAYWRYNSLVQLGNLVSARDELRMIQNNLDVRENHAYYRLLLHAQGQMSEAELWEGVEKGSVDEATVAYGLAMQALAAGDIERMRGLLTRAVGTGQWPAFGATAAEADLARLNRGELQPAPGPHERAEEQIREIQRERR